MATKIVINGESFVFNFDHRPMSEALALEKAYGAPYGQWEAELQQGSIKAMAGLVWLVWRRDGRDIPLADILDGTTEVDLTGLLDSLIAAGKSEAEAEEEAALVPTGAAAGATSPGPAGAAPGRGGTRSSGSGGSSSSRKSSTSRRATSTS